MSWIYYIGIKANILPLLTVGVDELRAYHLYFGIAAIQPSATGHINMALYRYNQWIPTAVDMQMYVQGCISTWLPGLCLKYLAAIQSTSKSQISAHGQTSIYPLYPTSPLQFPYISSFLQQHSDRRVVFKQHLLPHFRPPTNPPSWPSYSIGISRKWPQTRNLSSKIINTTLGASRRLLSISLCASITSVWLLPRDDLVYRFWMETNPPELVYIHDMHIALPPARISQHSVIIGDHCVTVNTDLQGPNEWSLEVAHRATKTRHESTTYSIMLPMDLQLNMGNALRIHENEVSTGCGDAYSKNESCRCETEEHTSWIRAWWRSYHLHWTDPTCWYWRCRPWTFRL